MAKSGNSSRINNEDNYRDRDDMKGQQSHKGEDIGDMGVNKGSERKRLVNEIDDNSYVEDTELEVVDDPKYWGADLQVGFADAISENYQKSLKKYVKLIKKTYVWVRDTELGQTITSIVAVRASIGLDRKTWERAEENSEEFLYYSDLIKDIVGARISHLGMTDSKGQIFKIFSIKNILPSDYADKKEISSHQTIEVIEIGGGSKKEIEEEISKSKKRLKK